MKGKFYRMSSVIRFRKEREDAAMSTKKEEEEENLEIKNYFAE